MGTHDWTGQGYSSLGPAPLLWIAWFGEGGVHSKPPFATGLQASDDEGALTRTFLSPAHVQAATLVRLAELLEAWILVQLGSRYA